MTYPSGLLLTIAATLVFAQSGQASNADLINAALNQNLQERDQVTGTYQQNDAADRPAVSDAGRGEGTRIAVEIESGLTSGGGSLRSYDSPSRVYREPRVEARLDGEVKAVDRAVDRAFQRSDSSESVNPGNGG